jgi:hypothetical protein
MAIKINSFQGISAMSANGTNRFRRTNPYMSQNPLWNFPVPLAHTFQGTVAGYVSAGFNPGPGALNSIEKYPFASDANSTDVADLSVSRYIASGQSSEVNGYVAGGYGPTFSNVIDKFPFASNRNATDVADLAVARYGLASQSSLTNGYASGGYSATPPVPSRYRTTIDKFSFATDSNSFNIGDLFQLRRYASGQSSDVSGYTSGGQRNPQASPSIPTFLVNTIDKFPFALDGFVVATDVGDLTHLPYRTAGQSSTVSGYVSGGYGRNPPGSPAPLSPMTTKNFINKFPFATDSNATDIADLTVSRLAASGQSSNVSGYTSGGYAASNTFNVIDKFPFATNANATDVGDLTIVMINTVGQQD